jgi:hypothetical protein
VEKVEEVTRVRFVASNGWWSTGGRPAGGAQAGWPRCGSAPVVLRSGRGRLVLGGLGGHAGLLGRRWTGRHELEKGSARELVHGQTAGACCGCAVPPVRGAAGVLPL